MVLLTELDHNQSHDHRYDVFLSFRGADTRNRFTAHLYNALLDASITTFMDDEEIETGEPLKPELESAIKSSRAFVIVLSKNYASSTWCLDELVLILEQQKNFNQIVIPIFYDVAPTDVRKQQNSFGEAMEKHTKRMEEDTDAEKRNQWAYKIKLWRMALTEVAGLKGKDAMDKKETEFIDEVVANVHRRLGVLLSNTLSTFIGRDYDIEFITSWLMDGSCHTADILTIVGIGGIGKTSLAKYVFGLHSSKFHKSSFIEGINTRCNDLINELPELQKQLHKVISRKISLQVNDVSKKVFIVLDDIGNDKQLNVLLGNKGLYPGSKIIITTKDASFIEGCALFNPHVQPKHKKVSLEGLYRSASSKLLCIHAFKSHKVKEGYEDVLEKLIKYCDGHPLALKVLGSSLHKQDVAHWEDNIKVLNKEPHRDIKKALQMSIDFLPYENDKELVKHIAFFFVGKDEDIIETILNACGIQTKSGITNLINRCLLSIEWGKLVMHSLIQEVAKDIVRQESPSKPWERSRLWCHQESFKVLKLKKGTENLLGMSLDMRKLEEKKLSGSLELKTDSLSNMENLMLLQLNYVQLNECLQNFPKELRWLCMHEFPLKSIHFNLPMENLVVLDMSYSKIEYFNMSCSNSQPPMKRQKRLVGSCSREERLLGTLKILDLSFCEHLYSVGGFSELPTLESLILRNCISLIELCESVEHCVELVHIDLSNCHNLKIPLLSLGNLNKVKILLLDGCNFQTSSSASMEAIPMDLKFLPIFLPNSLRELSLANANLSNESFPMDWSCLPMLGKLCLSGNPIVSMPDCVRTLPRLQNLDMQDCEMLISIEYPPRTLRRLSLFNECCEFKIRKIKFDPEMSPLACDGLEPFSSNWPVEIDGMVKIEDMACVEEKVLHSLGWTDLEFIKERCFRNHTLDKRSSCTDYETQTKMYYEFGIFSTFYEGKEMPNWIGYVEKGSSISYTIPLSPNKIRGLNFCCVGKSSHNFFSLPKIKISNMTKKNTWIYIRYFDEFYSYGHLTFKVVEGVYLCFLSHWMFGPNEMEGGDHITIEVIHSKSNSIDQSTMECGVGVVYDDGSMEEEKEDVLGYYKSWNHIIGGDLSDFQLTTRKYFLFSMGFEPHRDFELDEDEVCYKESKMRFKAFSQKNSKTFGSQDQCSQKRLTAMAPAGAPCMSMFPHGLGQHMFDGQAQSTLIPPQHQLVSGTSQDGGLMPNFSMPMVPQDQRGSRPGGGGVGVPWQENQQQQMSGENLYPRVEQLEAESEAKVTKDFLRLLESAEALKEMSGENLYPRVEQPEAESEAKVTKDFLRLLESPEALKEVEQADELASFLFS